MGAMTSDISTNSTSQSHWDELFAAPQFHYGVEPGQIARRAEKYHRGLRQNDSQSAVTALDQGCGEGQDLAFLAACGYAATGTDYSAQARRKAESLLAQQNLGAQVLEADLSIWQPNQSWDLVISINALPFVGERADFALSQTLRAVARGGVLGLSVWAREDSGSPAFVDGVRLWTRDEVFAALDESGSWQKLECATLWQYFRGDGNSACEEARPFVTVVAQKLK